MVFIFKYGLMAEWPKASACKAEQIVSSNLTQISKQNYRGVGKLVTPAGLDPVAVKRLRVRVSPPLPNTERLSIGELKWL